MVRCSKCGFMNPETTGEGMFGLGENIRVAYCMKCGAKLIPGGLLYELPPKDKEGDVVMAYSKEPVPEPDKRAYEAAMTSGKYHYQKKHYNEALAKFREAAQCAPDAASVNFARYMRAKVYFNTDSLDAALLEITQVLQWEPNSTAYQELKAKIEFNIKNKR